MKNCYLCGTEMEIRIEEREIRIGNRSAAVSVQNFRCPECGEEVIHPDQMDRAQKEASRLIREREGLLHPEEVKAIRESLGLTQAAFEDLLGVGRKTVVRWERGTVYQSKAIDTLLRLIAADPENARRLARWHQVELPHFIWVQIDMRAVATYIAPYPSIQGWRASGGGRIGNRTSGRVGVGRAKPTREQETVFDA